MKPHNKWLILYVVLLVFVSGMAFLSSTGYIVTHEAVHKVINKDYGIESEVNIGIWEGSTVPLNASEYHEKCDDTCRLSHNINEAFGYQIESQTISLWLILITFLIYDIFFRDAIRLRRRK